MNLDPEPIVTHISLSVAIIVCGLIPYIKYDYSPLLLSTICIAVIATINYVHYNKKMSQLIQYSLVILTFMTFLLTALSVYFIFSHEIDFFTSEGYLLIIFYPLLLLASSFFILVLMTKGLSRFIQINNHNWNIHLEYKKRRDSKKSQLDGFVDNYKK